MTQPGSQPRRSVTARADVQQQYQDSANLSARAAIYRYGSGTQRPWLTWVFEQLQFPDHVRILEVGCGPAALWRQKLTRLGASWRIVLSDLMPGMLGEGQRALGQDAARFHWALADVQNLPFADGVFDAVIANHMLYHVPQVDRALGEIRRVLKQGGRLCATTNGADHLGALRRLIDRFVSPPPGSEAASAPHGTEPFRLENGEAQLRRHFAHVERRITCDELAIPQAQLVVDYVLSIPGAPQQIAGPRFVQLQEAVQAEMPDGLFRTTTEAGMFIAQR